MAFTNSLASLVVNILVRTGRANREINKVKGNLVSTGGTALNTAAQLWILRAAFLVVRDAIGGVIKSTAEFETAIIRITSISKDLKNTGFGDAVEKLGLALSGIQVQSLADVALTAAKMGIEGKAAILEFSKVVTQFGLVTDTSVQAVADGFGRLAIIFGILPKDIEKLANAVLRVDEVSVVTAGDILSLTQQFAGFAATMGLNVRETIAFMAAMKSAGQTGTVSRNALHRLLVVLLRDTEKVGKALNLTTKEFRAFSVLIETDPAKGLERFFKIFKEFTGREQEQVLKEIGLSTVRVSGGMKALALAFGEYTKNLAAATEGMEDNVDLANRMFDRSDTLEVKINDLADAWEAFKRSLGEAGLFKDAIDSINILVTSLNELLDATEKSVPKLDSTNVKQLKAALRQAIDDKLDAEKRLLSINSFVTGGIGAIIAGFQVERANREIKRLKEQLNQLTTAGGGVDIEDVDTKKARKQDILDRLDIEERKERGRATKKKRDRQRELDRDIEEIILEDDRRKAEEQRKFAEESDLREQEQLRHLRDNEALRLQQERDEVQKKLEKLGDREQPRGFMGLVEAWKRVQQDSIIKRAEGKKLSLMQQQVEILKEIRDKKEFLQGNVVGV